MVDQSSQSSLVCGKNDEKCSWMKENAGVCWDGEGMDRDIRGVSLEIEEERSVNERVVPYACVCCTCERSDLCSANSAGYCEHINVFPPIDSGNVNSCVHNTVNHVYAQMSESLFGSPDSEDSDSDDVCLMSDSETSHEDVDLAPQNPIQNSERSFTFLHWNVEGLSSKLKDRDFVSFVRSFSFVCLVETFLVDFTSDVFTGYKPFFQPATKLSKPGRPSGGVLCLIRNELFPFVRRLNVDVGNFVLFVIDKMLFGLAKDVLYV